MRAAKPGPLVQGFGWMGEATARYLGQAGVNIVGIVDVHGVVNDGLDVERLLLTCDATGGMDRSQLRDGDTQLPADQRLTVPTDVLVPAAMSYCIDDSNQVDGEAHRRGRQHAGAA